MKKNKLTFRIPSFIFFNFNYVFIFERTVNNVNLKVTVLHDFTWNKLTKIFIFFSQSQTISCFEYFTLYRIVHRLFWSLLFSAFDIRLISVTFTRHKLRLKRPFATCVCLSFGSKPNNHLSEGLFLDMFNDETKGPFVCCFKHVSRH